MLRKNGQDFELRQDQMDVIAMYMDDDIREDLHGDLAPCSPELFLREYCARDKNFENLLWQEFSVIL